jgi:hypothetical protein
MFERLFGRKQDMEEECEKVKKLKRRVKELEEIEEERKIIESVYLDRVNHPYYRPPKVILRKNRFNRLDVELYHCNSSVQLYQETAINLRDFLCKHFPVEQKKSDD